MMNGGFVHRSAASKVILRPGARRELGRELAELGVRRPLVLSGARTARSALFRDAVASLGEHAEFTDVPPHSSVETVAAVAELARKSGADGFAAIGGGSASDTAKAAALWLAEGGALEQHASRFTPPDRLVIPELRQPKLPIAALPATASGAEVTPSAGVRTADGRKLIFSDVKLAGRLIVLDPEANVEVPAAVMLSTGMNGLAHCVEGLYSTTRTPVSTAVALHGIRLFEAALPRVAREPESAAGRAELLAAAHLGGLVLLNARTCLHHAICHAIGAVTGAAHGDANSVMLPHVAAFNYAVAPAEVPVERLRELQAALGVPTRLREIGVPQDALATVARKTMGERGLYFNPRPVRDAGEIEALLQAAW
jgi:alcohol dehydrogenase